MSKENRFEGLMGAVGKRSNVQTSKQQNVSPSTQDKENQHSDAKASEHPNIQTSEDNQKSSTKKTSTSKRSDVQTSKAKSANPDYVRTTIYLPKKMHKKLKAIAIEEEREMSEIMEGLLDSWLETK